MNKDEIQNIIKELLEKASVDLKNISITQEDDQNLWVSIEINNPHHFTFREGEGMRALNHLVHRILENRSPKNEDKKQGPNLILDINGLQKRRIENIKAVAHMMSERARYFKSNIEVDPMSAFERRIVHEFLSTASDLKTESVGEGRARRVVIKYIGAI